MRFQTRPWFLVLLPTMLIAAAAGSEEGSDTSLYDILGGTVENNKADGEQFQMALEEFLDEDPTVRAELRLQAEDMLGYWQNLERDAERSRTAGTRVWYHMDTHREFSRFGVGIGQSIVDLREAGRVDPSFIEVWAALGRLSLEVGNQEVAGKYLGRAQLVADLMARRESAVSEDVQLQIYHDRIWLLRDQARWDEGLALVREGLEYHKGDQDLVLLKGLMLAGSGEYEEANRLAVRMDPYEFPDLRYQHQGIGMRTSDYANRWIKSQALLTVGDIELALHVLGELDMEQYRRGMPHMSRFWNDAGLVAELLGDEKAPLYYALGLVQRPYMFFYPNRGSNLEPLVLDIPDPRLPYFTSFGPRFYIAGSPFSFVVGQMNQMAMGVFPQAKEQAAKRALQMLDVLEQRNLRPHICRALRGRILYQQGELEAARVELAAARAGFAASDRVDSGTSLLLGLLFLDADHFEIGLPYLEESVQADPNSATAWRSYGVALSGAGKLEEADAAFVKALEIEPRSVTGLYNRGLNHCIAGDFLAAVTELDHAFRLDPENLKVQGLLQTAAANLRAESGGRMPVQVKALETAGLGDGTFDGNPQALMVSLLKDLDGVFLENPHEVVPPDQVERMQKAYARDANPATRQALALATLRSGDSVGTQALLGPRWGGDLSAEEILMLLYADRAQGDRRRATALAVSMLSGEVGTENPYLWALVMAGQQDDPAFAQAGELKLAFERFVSFNMNVLGQSADQWLTAFRESGRDEELIPAGLMDGP